MRSVNNVIGISGRNPIHLGWLDAPTVVLSSVTGRGSWSIDIETSGKNGNLTGDNPSANLYADLIINPVDELSLETYLAPQSGDYANLHRTFTYHLP